MLMRNLKKTLTSTVTTHTTKINTNKTENNSITKNIEKLQYT